MSNADRIEELRTKYEENPRRYFAPLANEFRKAGDLAQAIAICREHLPKQPGHMSGYIVYGQTLFEANNLDEARTVFEQALTLDPENLIALKHLGDIARMNGDNGVARRWYARVLDADPRNDDIASQLALLGAPTPAVSLPVIPPPAAYSEPPANEAIGVFATFDPSSLLDVPDDVAGIAGAREFWTPAETRPATFHEPLDLDFPDSPEPQSEAEAAFEEGIMAPEWPDTTELVARIVTPLRSVTPVSVAATPEAVEAFGREISDELVAKPVDAAPQDELVDAFLPPEGIATAPVTSELVTLEAAPTPMDAELVEFAATEFNAVSSEQSATSESDDAMDRISVDVSVMAERPESSLEAGQLEETDGQFEHEQDADELDADEPDADEPLEHEPHAAFELQALPELSAFSEPLSVATLEPVVEGSSTDAADMEFESLDAAMELPLPDASVIASDDSSVEDVASDTALPLLDWAEPESVPTTHPAGELEVVETPANDVPSDVAGNTEAADVDLNDTAEFEIPELAKSGAFAAVEPMSLPDMVDDDHVLAPVEAEFSSVSVDSSADASFADVSSDASFADVSSDVSFADVSSDVSFEAVSPDDHSPENASDEETLAEDSIADAFVGITVDESRAEIAPEYLVAEIPPADVGAEFATEESISAVTASDDVLEESFAAVSSEVQSERDATERDATERDATERDATERDATERDEPERDAIERAATQREQAQPFVTETMAELLVSQGFNARAVEVYEELVRRRPHDPVLVARLTELRSIAQDELTHVESVANAPTPRFSTPLRNTPVYNTPLYNTPLYNTPVSNTPLYNTPVSNTPLYNTPLYNTPLAATPIAVPALDTSASTQSNLSERHASDRLQAFRTARERFAELSRRRVARRTPTHATAISDDSADGLSSLFGTSAPATTDELAARALADAFGPVQDSGESLFDPAPAPVPAMPLRSFTPRSNSVQMPPAAESRSDRQPPADYSFDKFFPDPAMAAREAPSAPTTVVSTPSSSQPVNEDLAQFSAWLKGLNNA